MPARRLAVLRLTDASRRAQTGNWWGASIVSREDGPSLLSSQFRIPQYGIRLPVITLIYPYAVMSIAVMIPGP